MKQMNKEYMLKGVKENTPEQIEKARKTIQAILTGPYK